MYHEPFYTLWHLYFAISQVIEDNQIGVFCGIKPHRRTSHGHIFLSSVSILYSAASCTDFQTSQLNLHKPCVFHKNHFNFFPFIRFTEYSV